MNFKNVSVLSVAHVDAPHRVTSEEIEQQLASRIRDLRLSRNWKQSTLAERSGVLEALLPLGGGLVA